MFKLSDNYDLRTGSVLGRGTDGSVIRGVERKSGKWHAIKFISRDSDDPTGAREKALTTRVQHPKS